MENKGILGLGTLLVDKTKIVPSYPQETMLVNIVSLERHCGGCINTVVNLAKIDPQLDIHLAGMTAEDSDGEFIRNTMNHIGVKTDMIQRSDKPTSFTDVMINQKTGDRTFFHHIGAMADLDFDYITKIKEPVKIIHLAYLLVLPGLDQEDSEYGSVAARALCHLQGQGYKVSVDLVSDPDMTRYQKLVKPALPYIDYLIINDSEAAALLQKNIDDLKPDDYEAMAKELLEFGVQDTVVIHYPHGASAATKKGEILSFPSYWVNKHEIISTLGAGDAFCSGVLYGLHEEYEIKKCLQLGTAMAHFNLFSLSATGGAASLETLLQFIQET